MKKISVIALLLGISSLAYGQKFGYTNLDYIVQYLPEYTVAQTEVNEYEQQLGQQLQSKIDTYQRLVAEFNALDDNVIDAVKQDKAQEIGRLEQDIQQFQANAQQLISTKELTVIQPLYGKVMEAINALAAAEGFTYIFDSSTLLFAPEGEEISELVFKQLGIEPPAQPEGGQ
ncbi:MAG TPA: hypothetical protein DCE41_03315 [Cytophagales bacterium]|nr:hypothetical protein [Cytophagales bacterium]HAA23406.1 hypothetical protein [Cytophagales bacterium]HAP58113.1 hypothetical protein [Cytophagales bacterium]